MKIKSLLIGMLACTALVGCSDDVIDNEVANQDKAPAYLTISFSPNSNSSRSTADNANNKGDKDGSPEESGHVNVGTNAENVIKNVLVVVKSVSGQNGYAQLYEVSKSETKEDATNSVFEALGSNGDTFFNQSDPIKLSVGTYDVLIVANPYSSLYSTAGENINTGINGDVSTLYNNILNGEYNAEAPKKTQNFAGDIVKVENNTLKSIMMANKAAAQVELKATNTPDNPAEAEVTIERSAAKVTFRHHGVNTSGKVVLVTDENSGTVQTDVYPVSVPIVSSVKAKVKTVTDGAVTTNYNYATGTVGGEVVDIFVVLDSDKSFNKAYNRTGDNIGDEITLDSNTAINYLYEEGTYEEDTWYVKLEQYALINLSKKAYNVRHIVSNGSTGAPFGTLNKSNFLWTPNWPEINDVEFDADGGFATADFTTNHWFNQTLAEVSKETKDKNGAEPAQYFLSLNPTTQMGDVDDKQDVSGEEHTPNYNAIGNLLAYCLENSTDIEHQTHGLSTGITFMAKMYKDATCTVPVEKLYRYAGHLFESIEAIQKAYGVTADEGAEGLAGLTESSNADALAAAQVAKYAGNTCYYYTTEIKHYDNSDPVGLGNMEFAIMRNNIYSLAVKNVNVIGDPYVDPTPSTPNELKETALVVEAEIMPWIVRYHDIEFK